MKKGGKIALIALLVAGLLGGAGYGGWRVYDSYHGGSVDVYPLENLTTAYWGDETETEGYVTTDNLQTEYLSDTQTVEEIKVKKGQKVKKGDVLFTYDSTLTDIDLKRKQIEVQQKELELENTRKELKVIRTYRAGVPIPGSSFGGGGGGGFNFGGGGSQRQEKPTYDGLFLVSGKGTKKEPYSYIWKEGFIFSDDLLAAAMQGDKDAFVTFYMTGDDIVFPAPVVTTPEEPKPEDQTPATDGNAQESPKEEDKKDNQKEDKQDDKKDGKDKKKPLYGAAWTMHCQNVDGVYRYVMYSVTVGGVERQISKPLPPLEEEAQLTETDGNAWNDGGGVDGIVYTSTEIASMIREKEQAIKTLDLESRQLKLEAEKLEKELNNSAVYSNLDGVVSLVSNPNELEDGTPLVKVSGGGGYLVRGTISELDLEKLTPDMEFTISSWDTGESCTGTLQSLSEYPTTNGSYWGDGNSNVSLYPFYVAVDESANLPENSYVSLSYTAAGQSGGQSLYLMKSFVRTEGGKSYVYIDNGGKLEKRTVTTGRDLWGSYVEIKEDLGQEAKLAFPYGQKVKENAPTAEGSMESLYNY